MKKFILLSLLTAAALPGTAQNAVSGYPYSPVPFTSVKVGEGFWGQRIHAARQVTIPLAFSKCESEGRYANFVMAAHPSPDYDVSSFMGFSFDDTDVYKTIEGASYVLQTYPDRKLTAYIDSVLDIVAAAQEPDGYLYTARTINPARPHSWAGRKRWEKEEVLSHELYNLGHMVDAACAHFQATGSRKFLDIAERYAQCCIREVGRGEGQAHVVPGHQIAEMALARLYVLTGRKEYLDFAKYLLDDRGKTARHDVYSQSHKPVVEQDEAVGHAVRAGYMYAGMADVAALTGEQAYVDAIHRIWDNIISHKYYLTGGVGARHAGESFGNNDELPNLTAYNETCAAISMVYLFQRMFLFEGDAKYIDCLERTLYNAVIDGMSLDGGAFFYPNPLASDAVYRFNSDNTLTRQPWFGCACCPSNLSRFIPSVPGYVYAQRDRSLYVNLFMNNSAGFSIGGKSVRLRQETAYPWDGDIRIVIDRNSAGSFDLKVRIPGWVRNRVVPSDLYTYADNAQLRWSVSVNGETQDPGLLTADGYMTLTRRWKKGDVVSVHFDMEPRMVVADRRVKDDRGSIAFERGPLVYCAESPVAGDGQGQAPTDLFHLTVAPQQPVAAPGSISVKGTDYSYTALSVKAQTYTQRKDGTFAVAPCDLTLIPYYVWNHRGPAQMKVWFKTDPFAEGE